MTQGWRYCTYAVPHIFPFQHCRPLNSALRIFKISIHTPRATAGASQGATPSPEAAAKAGKVRPASGSVACGSNVMSSR